MQFVTTTLVGIALTLAATTAHGVTPNEASLATVNITAEAPEEDTATVTGILIHVMAIGGESTGTALLLADGSTVEIDLVDAGLAEWGMTAEGLDVMATGRYVDVEGVEIPMRRVLVVEGLELVTE